MKSKNEEGRAREKRWQWGNGRRTLNDEPHRVADAHYIITKFIPLPLLIPVTAKKC